MISIEVLPDDVLLAIFDFYVNERVMKLPRNLVSISSQTFGRGVVAAGTRVSVMANHCLQITPSPQSATWLFIQYTRQGEAGYLASVTSLHF